MHISLAVIEESAMVARIYDSCLSGTPYKASFFKSTPQSLEKLLAGRFDLVIIPEYPTHRDRLAIAAAIKAQARFSGISIIISTSRQDRNLSGEWDSTQVDGALAKPFDRQTLLGVLEQVSAGRRSYRPAGLHDKIQNAYRGSI